MTASGPRGGSSTTDLRIQIRHVAVTLATADDESRGLLGWAVLDLGMLLVDAVSIRRTLKGETRVVMPMTRRERGGRYPVVTVVDAELCGRIFSAVVAEYMRVRARAGRRVSP